MKESVSLTIRTFRNKKQNVLFSKNDTGHGVDHLKNIIFSNKAFYLNFSLSYTRKQSFSSLKTDLLEKLLSR